MNETVTPSAISCSTATLKKSFTRPCEISESIAAKNGRQILPEKVVMLT